MTTVPSNTNANPPYQCKLIPCICCECPQYDPSLIWMRENDDSDFPLGRFFGDPRGDPKPLTDEEYFSIQAEWNLRPVPQRTPSRVFGKPPRALSLWLPEHFRAQPRKRSSRSRSRSRSPVRAKTGITPNADDQGRAPAMPLGSRPSSPLVTLHFSTGMLPPHQRPMHRRHASQMYGPGLTTLGDASASQHSSSDGSMSHVPASSRPIVEPHQLPGQSPSPHPSRTSFRPGVVCNRPEELAKYLSACKHSVWKNWSQIDPATQARFRSTPVEHWDGILEESVRRRHSSRSSGSQQAR